MGPAGRLKFREAEKKKKRKAWKCEKGEEGESESVKKLIFLILL